MAINAIYSQTPWLIYSTFGLDYKSTCGGFFAIRQIKLYDPMLGAVSFPSMEYNNLRQIASRNYAPQKTPGINR